MTNYSTLTRKDQVLQKLLDANGSWVDGPDLANEEVGGSEGLKRLRELKAEGNDVRMRKHPDQSRDIFQYRLARTATAALAEETGRTYTDAHQSTISDQMHERSMATQAVEDGVADPEDVAPLLPAPEPAEVYEYKQPPKATGRGHLGRTEDGTYVLVRDEPPVATGQMEAFDQIDAIGEKFLAMPTVLELGRTVPCPRCGGYRRTIRERDPVTNKQIKGGRVIGYEEKSRDPHKPSLDCPRCNGWGVVPR